MQKISGFSLGWRANFDRLIKGLNFLFRDCYLFYGESSRCLFVSQANQSRLLRVSHTNKYSEPRPESTTNGMKSLDHEREIWQEQDSEIDVRSKTESGELLLYIGDMYIFSYALSVANFVPIFPWFPQALPDITLNMLRCVEY